MTSEKPQSNVAYRSINPPKKQHRLCQAILLSPWFYIFSVGFITALVIGVYIFFQSKSKSIDIDRLEVSKCPACFGQTACPAFFRGDIRLPTFYGSRPIYATDFEKFGDLIEVELGTFERKPAVLRRLQFPATSEAVDIEVCRHQKTDDFIEGSPQPRCVPHLSIWRWVATTGTGTAHPIDLKLLRTTSTFTQCASPRLQQLIQSRFRERSTMSSLPTQSRWLRFDELTLLFNLAVNPHGVIASTFPLSEGWPLPVQLGSCGRISLERGTSKYLSYFVHAPTTQRLQVLKSLLQLPYSLMSDSSLYDSADFVLYLGDYRWDVFGVDVFTFKVSVIQARHLIAVDLRKTIKSASFYTIESNSSCMLKDGDLNHHFASNLPCLSETYANQLCTMDPSNGHNYWAVCMTALHGKRLLVQDMPSEIIFRLEQCIRDTQIGAQRSHVEAALKVINVYLAN